MLNQMVSDYRLHDFTYLAGRTNWSIVVDQDRDLASQDQDRIKFGIKCSRDQERGPEDYIPE